MTQTTKNIKPGAAAVGEFWAIKNEYGFYVGTWQKRHEAIGFHLKALGKTWAYCQAKGDRAVKVMVKEIVSELPTWTPLKRKRCAPGQKNVKAYRSKHE